MFRLLIGSILHAGDKRPEPQQNQPFILAEQPLQTSVQQSVVETSAVEANHLPKEVDVYTKSKVKIAYECEYETRFHAMLSDDGKYYQTPKDEYISVNGLNGTYYAPCPTGYIRNAKVPSAMLHSEDTTVNVNAEVYAVVGNVSGTIELTNVSKNKGFNRKIHSEATLFAGNTSVKSETIIKPVVETPDQHATKSNNRQF